MQKSRRDTDNKWVNENCPDEIVIHWWDDPAKHPSLEGVIKTFQMSVSEVSAHYIVSDKIVVQMVDETDAAWHALSANRYSIGIEIDPNFPGSTYETVGELVREIRSRWGDLPLIRHRDVPGVSTVCPGTTDIDLIERYSRGETEMKTDIGMVRQMAQTVGGRIGRNGFPDTSGPDLNGHVGKETGEEFTSWYWSKEAMQWRDHALPDILNVWEKYKTLGPQLEAVNSDLSKRVASLQEQNTQLGGQASEDTQLLNDTGNLFSRFWARIQSFFTKK